MGDLFGRQHIGDAVNDLAAFLILVALLLFNVFMVHGILVLRWVRRWLKQQVQ